MSEQAMQDSGPRLDLPVGTSPAGKLRMLIAFLGPHSTPSPISR